MSRSAPPGLGVALKLFEGGGGVSAERERSFKLGGERLPSIDVINIGGPPTPTSKLFATRLAETMVEVGGGFNAEGLGAGMGGVFAGESGERLS